MARLLLVALVALLVVASTARAALCEGLANTGGCTQGTDGTGKASLSLSLALASELTLDLDDAELMGGLSIEVAGGNVTLRFAQLARSGPISIRAINDATLSVAFPALASVTGGFEVVAGPKATITELSLPAAAALQDLTVSVEGTIHRLFASLSVVDNVKMDVTGTLGRTVLSWTTPSAISAVEFAVSGAGKANELTLLNVPAIGYTSIVRQDTQAFLGNVIIEGIWEPRSQLVDVVRVIGADFISLNNVEILAAQVELSHLSERQFLSVNPHTTVEKNLDVFVNGMRVGFLDELTSCRSQGVRSSEGRACQCFERKRGCNNMDFVLPLIFAVDFDQLLGQPGSVAARRLENLMYSHLAAAPYNASREDIWSIWLYRDEVLVAGLNEETGTAVGVVIPYIKADVVLRQSSQRATLAKLVQDYGYEIVFDNSTLQAVVAGSGIPSEPKGQEVENDYIWTIISVATGTILFGAFAALMMRRNKRKHDLVDEEFEDIDFEQFLSHDDMVLPTLSTSGPGTSKGMIVVNTSMVRNQNFYQDDIGSQATLAGQSCKASQLSPHDVSPGFVANDSFQISQPAFQHESSPQLSFVGPASQLNSSQLAVTPVRPSQLFQETAFATPATPVSDGAKRMRHELTGCSDSSLRSSTGPVLSPVLSRLRPPPTYAVAMRAHSSPNQSEPSPPKTPTSPHVVPTSVAGISSKGPPISDLSSPITLPSPIGPNGFDSLCEEQRAFATACVQGQEDVIERLLADGATVTFFDASGRSPLALASAKNHSTIVRRLLRAGATAEPDKHGLSPLMQAVIHECIEAVKELIKSPSILSSINHRDASGNTALHWAISLRQADMVRLLLSCQSIDLKTVNTRGRTVFHEAARKGDLEIVSELLTLEHVNIRALLELVDERSLTPVQHAEQAGHMAVATMFRSISSALQRSKRTRRSSAIMAAPREEHESGSASLLAAQNSYLRQSLRQLSEEAAFLRSQLRRSPPSSS
eukprot:m.83111 g.83111  ORF g.83111 m.83111 type:complete len:988 (+) comp8289_c0_seq1:291-3254(+)